MTTALEGGEGSASRPGRSLPPGKTRYPLYRRLTGPQGRSGQMGKISSLPGFDSRTVQPVASRYTDYATRPTCLYVGRIVCSLLFFRLQTHSCVILTLHRDKTHKLPQYQTPLSVSFYFLLPFFDGSVLSLRLARLLSSRLVRTCDVESHKRTDAWTSCGQ